MKKLVLLGDSIRLIGYGTKIAEYLPKDVEIFQPEDNCRFGKYMLRMLFDLKDQIKDADIIHFNFGLWDACALFGDDIPFSSLDEYGNVLSRVADILLSYGKTVIFSTITPIKKGQPHNTNERICEYNKKAIEVLSKKKVIINDLFSVIYPHVDAFIRDDDCIHLTEVGINVAAQEIADLIKKYL